LRTREQATSKVVLAAHADVTVMAPGPTAIRVPVTPIAVIGIALLVPVDRCIMSIDPSLLMILRAGSRHAKRRKRQHRG
jgi:hypothetical protein